MSDEAKTPEAEGADTFFENLEMKKLVSVDAVLAVKYIDPDGELRQRAITAKGCEAVLVTGVLEEKESGEKKPVLSTMLGDPEKGALCVAAALHIAVESGHLREGLVRCIDTGGPTVYLALASAFTQALEVFIREGGEHGD